MIFSCQAIKLICTSWLAIDSGVFPIELANTNLGVIHPARWITTASRVLRYYASVKKPSKQLIKTVTFIQRVYVPCMFWIKRYPSWIYGPRHFYRILSFSRDLTPDIVIAVRDRLIYNSYFAHIENVLLSMIADDDQTIREAAFNKIVYRREERLSTELVGNVRKFYKPTIKVINDACTNYTNMIDWDNQVFYEPPFTQQFSSDELEQFKNSGKKMEIPDIPCHSQATEFCVQYVSHAVNKVVGHQAQEALVRTQFLARKLMPDNNSKKDFVCYKLV